MIHLPRPVGYTLMAAFLCLGIQAANAQSASQYVIASAGSSIVLSGGNTFTFTTGEPIITTAGSNPILTQGFNQPTMTTVPLPVRLDFSGAVAGTGNQLNWTTYQEIANNHFELERSGDGIRYSSIATIATKAPNGTSSSKINYTYLDQSFAAGNNYYRLKQVDINGKYTYSSVVLLQDTKALDIFSISPNPATDKVRIKVPESGDLSVIDVNGRTLLTSKIDAETELNISGFVSGAYFVNFTGKTQTASLRFIKK